jgi:hypothetical protein
MNARSGRSPPSKRHSRSTLIPLKRTWHAAYSCGSHRTGFHTAPRLPNSGWLPPPGRTWSEIASVLIHIGHLDEALVELGKAEALNPGQTSASEESRRCIDFRARLSCRSTTKAATDGVTIPIVAFNRTWALIDLTGSRCR